MKKYIIISTKHGTAKKPMFWRADNKGYCYSPFTAGVYSEEQIKSQPDYYNNGDSTVAVPLTEQGMESIGFKCSYDNGKLLEYIKNNTNT